MSASSASGSPRFPRPLLAGLVVTGALVAVSSVAFVAARRTAELAAPKPEKASDSLPSLYPAPAFSLVSQLGKTVTLADLKGKVWVASFVFVGCSGICPMMNARTASLARTFASEPDVRFVAFDVDPERDSLESIAAHARGLGADPTRWLFLRPPDVPTIRTLSREGFKLAIEDAAPTVPAGPGASPGALSPPIPYEPILHSSRFVLVDRDSRIRGYYDASEGAAMARLEADLRKLLAQRPPA